jgi:hypothetical protein
MASHNLRKRKRTPARRASSFGFALNTPGLSFFTAYLHWVAVTLTTAYMPAM